MTSVEVLVNNPEVALVDVGQLAVREELSGRVLMWSYSIALLPV